MEDRVKTGRGGKRKRLGDLLTQIRGLDATKCVWDESTYLSQDQILSEYIQQAQIASRVHRAEKTLSDFSDADLIMEMLKRGYAAMKLPEDGGPPEVLRNG